MPKRSRRRSDEGKQDAFSEQLPDQPRPARAQRQTDADLALPRYGSRERQVGDVGTGNQQHHGDQYGQHGHEADREAGSRGFSLLRYVSSSRL